jgi:L,D-peptidoglycan transpeptidase YkuD (ErfK/YbiS/YcfS/YnhG family)
MSAGARAYAAAALAATALLAGACARAHPTAGAGMPAASTVMAPRAPEQTTVNTQLIVVTTADWDSVSGTLQRYERRSAQDAWRAVGTSVPIVVGRSGLGWGVGEAGATGPRKQEGDGRAPAGRFPLDTAFGFAPASSSRWVRLAYVPLDATSECVDDRASRYYNTVVERNAVPRVDWTSAEQMRSIDQYRLGVIVGYNATPPVAGAGSCIFLHIWAGPGMPTTGCTAMPEHDLTGLVMWLDRARRPMLVQLPRAEYAQLRERWQLP